MTDNHDELERLIGKSADGCVGHEVFAPARAARQSWIRIAEPRYRESRYRWLLRLVQRWLTKH